MQTGDSELARWFAHATDIGHMTDEVGLEIDADDERWKKRATSEGPSVWRRLENPITERITATLCQDQTIDPKQPGGARRSVRTVAVDLLIEAGGNWELVLNALERSRKNPRWPELSIWVMKKQLEMEMAKIRSGAARRAADASDFFDNETMPPDDWWER